MECNKDEAIRAKEIAEKKMSNNDFEGARKIALKAQNLSPELDNISQLLSICDVHCSAQTRILGSEKDWYGILQVQRLADQITIKKQYRRLALILHPDKNRFPGAEAAFKLICEANAVLSDTVKKTLYDNKVHVSIRCATVNPSPRPNQNGQFNKQQGVKNNIPNGFNQQQASGSNPSVRLDVFWTCCPYCSIKYQYHRQFVNRSLRCPTCLKPYMAYEIGSRIDPMGPKRGQPGAHVKPESSQPASSQPKPPNPGTFKMGAQNFKGGAEGIFSKIARPEPGIQTGSGSEGIRANEHKPDPKANGTRNDNTNPMNEGGKYNGASMKRESGNPKNKNKKRGRKQVVESRDSFDCSNDSDADDVTTKEAFVYPETDMKSEANRAARRSVRRKHNVTYNESDIDDLDNSLKTSNASTDGEEDKKGALHGEDLKNGNKRSFTLDTNAPKPESKKTVDFPEEILQKKDAKIDCVGTARGETGIKLGNGAEKVEIESESDIDLDNSDKCRFDCPDPEFNDFDKLRDASRFKVDQYWACYDPFDDMPRFYAKVKKVTASPFEVRITWLEAVPINKVFKNWVDEELPVGCGTFKMGGNDKIFAVDTFSHEVQEVQKITKGKKTYFSINPRKGEIWALFKDWDTSWSSDKINQKEFKYEVVEVISDFVEGAGIKVCYLDKVAGFVSLFQKKGESEADSFFVGPDKVYKFSHRVPSFKMTGSERAGVPVGSFELDPASLPLNPDNLHLPPKAKIESGNLNSGVFCSPAKSVKKTVNTVTTDSKSKQKYFVDLDGSDETSKEVRKSPRGVNFARKNTRKTK